MRKTLFLFCLLFFLFSFANAQFMVSDTLNFGTAVDLPGNGGFWTAETGLSNSTVLDLHNSIAKDFSEWVGSGVALLYGQPMYAQCGGIGWTGNTTCEVGTVCTYINDYYSQCLTGTTPPVIIVPPSEIGLLSIELSEGNKEVCPSVGGGLQSYHYTAIAPENYCEVSWEFSPAHPNFSNTATTTGTDSTLISWNTPSASYSASTQTWSLPKGRIKITSDCGSEQTSQAEVVLLSVKGYAVPWIRTIGESGTDLPDGSQFYLNYGDMSEFTVRVPQLNYLNSTKKITHYEWSIPKGWKTIEKGDETTFVLETNTNLDMNIITVIPDKCSGGEIKVRPVDYVCRNECQDDLKGNWVTINVIRTPEPTISVTPDITAVQFSHPTPITFNATSTPTADSYKWEAVSGFAETGVLPQTASSVTLTHTGCSTATLKTSAMCEDQASIYVSQSIPVNDRPAISGTEQVCLSASYALSIPALQVSSWSVTEGFEIVSQDAASATVTVTRLDKQTGTLTAIVNGCLISKTIQACDISDITISGPEIICTAPTTYTLDIGSATSWSVTDGFAIISQTATSATVEATRLNKQTGTLTAVMNGIPISKTIQACEVTLSFSVNQLERFTPVTVTFNNVPQRNDYTLQYSIPDFNSGSVVILEQVGTSFTFVPPNSGTYSITAYLTSPTGRGYRAEKKISVLPIDVWIEGPNSLAPGQEGTYTLRTSSQNPVDPMVAGYPWGSYKWTYGPNLQAIDSTPTSITLKSTRTSEDCGDQKYPLTLELPLGFWPLPAKERLFSYANNGITLTAPNSASFRISLYHSFSVSAYDMNYAFTTTPPLGAPVYQQPVSGSFVWEYTTTVNPNDPNDFNYIYTYGHFLPLLPQSTGGWIEFQLPKQITNFTVRAKRTSPCGESVAFYHVRNQNPYSYFQISPNPSDDHVVIQPAENADQSTTTPLKTAISPNDNTFIYELYEQYSLRPVQRGTFGGGEHTLNVSNLQTGLYILKIIKGEHSEMHRLVVNH